MADEVRPSWFHLLALMEALDLSTLSVLLSYNTESALYVLNTNFSGNNVSVIKR